MARPRVVMNRAEMRKLLHDPGIEQYLLGLAENVAHSARRDPNPEYVKQIRVTSHHSEGRESRVSARVGAAFWETGGVNKKRQEFGMAVEAKRGTLARALGEA